ncbi:MAG: precorrin-4 C(11)-methyltransferase [Deltaproteobacteria bacterium]|nr:precorrin-4 C(11)-methyltransferase [Deltaproteobacteria bacterium]
MTEASSAVYFIGAGPGDPELITVKGMRLLQEADVVVYAGSLVQRAVLKFCRPGIEAHDSAMMDLDAIVDVMVNAAKAGRRCARLHTGDPGLYGALREQTSALEAAGISYEIVPGVSSAFASAAALKRELTVPGGTQTVIFTRLAGRTPVPVSEGLASLASHNATICVFLSAASIDDVVAGLSAGYPAGTPAAVVYKVTWEDERIIIGTLADISAKVKEAGITRHALVIVGAALGEGAGAASKLYDKAFSHGYRPL